MIQPESWPPIYLYIAFVAAALVVGWFGIKMTTTARDLAHETGMGEALMGALFIGASTSLSGLTTSVTAAASGFAELAVSNSLGGIAAQTVFLAFADIAYRRANLEHAAASAENLFMTALLMTLLSIHMVGIAVPDISFWSVHPVTLLLLAAYLLGIQLLARTHTMPMWLPRKTRDTPAEKQRPASHRPKGMTGLWVRFLIYSSVVAAAGWFLAQLAVPIVQNSGLSYGIVGGIFTAVSTSIPELVVAVTAVRMGALNLAVGDIIGGNAFDTLFIAASDVAYREGPIYAAVSGAEVFWLADALVMTGVVMMGLLYRQRHGPGNIGLESTMLLLLYFGGVALLGFGAV
ncbi:sodium:calcium antiporter [Sulfurimonas sp. HSL1-2]|uniref:sodium:calcium antiporter n=1 Tax=Thiomicrolovo zhangzhouensis TaxID=3131933 RepID=UPI0031F7703A